MFRRKTVFVSLALVLAGAGLLGCNQMTNALPLTQEQYDAQIQKAEQLQSQNKFKEAIEEMQNLSKRLKPSDGKQDPRMIKVLVTLGFCLEKDGQESAAIDVYERAMQVAIAAYGSPYVDTPALAEAPLRATILRCQSHTKQPENVWQWIDEDFNYGVKTIAKYGSNIKDDLKEKFFKTYEDYLLKEKRQPDAERVSSIAQALFKEDQFLKSKGDKLTGLIAAADLFSNPLNDSSEENDSETCNRLLKEALGLSKNDEQKTTIELKRAERLMFDQNYDECEKQFGVIKKISKNLTKLTPAQKLVYWKLKARFATSKEQNESAKQALEECINVVNSAAQLPPDATLRDVNYTIEMNRLGAQPDASETLLALCEASKKLDGEKSFSYGTSCVNYGTYDRLSHSGATINGAMSEKQGVEILAKLPHPQYGHLATIGVNAGNDLLGLKHTRAAADLLEITLVLSKKDDEQTLANGEELNPTNCSPKAIEDQLATAYSELKDFDKLKALSGDTGSNTKVDGVVEDNLDTKGLLRKAYMLEQESASNYRLVEKYYDAASEKILRAGKFSEQYDLAHGPQSNAPFSFWTSQHIPEGLIGFYERLGRYDKIARFTESENQQGEWQRKDGGQLAIARLYFLGGDYNKALSILPGAYAAAPAYVLDTRPHCGTGAPVMKDQFARLMVEAYLDGERNGQAAETLYNDKASGLALPVIAEDDFNHALALDLQKKYDQSKIYHEKVLAAQQMYVRPGFDRKPDLDAYRKLAFKPDRSIEETAQLMETFAWLHDLPETTLSTAVDRANVYRKKHLGAKAPEVIDAMKRQIARCEEIKEKVKYAECRSLAARRLRLQDAQS